MRPLLPIAFLLLWLVPAAAQVDEETDDHEEQDRRYFERYLEKDKEQAPQPADPRARFLARAEELVRDKNYGAASSDHYRVQSDDPRLRARSVVELLDAFRGFFSEFLAPRVELALPEDQSRVFLYYSFHKYNRLLAGDWSRSYLRPQGHYIDTVDVVAAHTGAGAPQDLGDSLIHEAAHQLVDKGLTRDGFPLPPWASEGLAAYFGYTYRDEHGFRAGEIGGKSVELIRGSPKGRPVESAGRLRVLRAALKSRKNEDATTVVDEVVGLVRPASFYEGKTQLHYAASWMLVHFLFHADGGRYADPFVSYLAQELRGEGGRDVFYETVGLDPGELDAVIARHAKTVKIR